MPLPIWPPGLPQKPTQRGFEEQYPASVLRSPMAGGVEKSRPTTTNPQPVMVMQFTMTGAQYLTYRDFWLALGNGALPFEWVHPIDGTTIKVTLQDPPSRSPLGGDYYSVPVKMRVQP